MFFNIFLIFFSTKNINNSATCVVRSPHDPPGSNICSCWGILPQDQPPTHHAPCRGAPTHPGVSELGAGDISELRSYFFFFYSSPFIISHFVPKSQVFFKNFFKFLVPNFGTPYQTFVRFTKQKKETLQSLYTIRLLRKLQFLQVHFSLKVREFFLNEQELR